MSLLSAIKSEYQRLRRALDSSRLPEHLRNREHLWSSAGGSVVNNELASFVSYATVYQQYVWVRKAINLIIDAIAVLPVGVYNADGELVTNHQLTTLLKNGNAKMDAATVWRLFFMYHLIAGEGFIEFVGSESGNTVLEMWARRPDWVDLYPDADGILYPAAAEYVFSPTGEQPIAIPATDMLHMANQNPLNEWRGISLIHAVREGITLDLMSMLWSKAMLKRGGEPTLAVTTERSIAPNELKRIETMLEAKRRTGQTLILDDSQKLQMISHSPKDMEWLAQREMSRDEVAAIFGVPDELMGFGQNTYENFERAWRVFWSLTLKPLLDRRDLALTSHFTKTRPMLRNGETIRTDTSGVAALQDDNTPRIDNAVKLFNLGVPFNTLDERLRLGIGPVPGGDIGYLQGALLPANEMALALPAPAPKHAKPIVKALRYQTKAQREATLTRQTRTLLRLRRETARKATTEIDDYFKALADTVVERARSAEAKKAWHKKALPTLSELLLPEDSNDLTNVIGSFCTDVIELSWPTWNEQLGLSVEFGLDDPAVVAALEQAAEDVSAIEETTRAALKELLQYGVEQGWTIDQLVDGTDERSGLRSLVSETYRGRARTIARTEVGNAQQLAACERYEASGVEQVQVFDGGSPTSCQVCNDLNKTIQTMAWARLNKLGHPRCARAIGPHYED